MQRRKEEVVSREELLLWVEVGGIEVTSQFQLYKEIGLFLISMFKREIILG